jgi:hypothetical protein
MFASAFASQLISMSAHNVKMCTSEPISDFVGLAATPQQKQEFPAVSSTGASGSSLLELHFGQQPRSLDDGDCFSFGAQMEGQTPAAIATKVQETILRNIISSISAFCLTVHRFARRTC